MLRKVLSSLASRLPGSHSPGYRPPVLAAGLRPAEAGVVMAAGARPAHIAATLIDLSIRGYLRIAETGDDDDPDWLLTRCAARASGAGPGGPGPAGSLARYERVLLRGLPGDRAGSRLSQLKTTKAWVKAVSRVYHQLNREAIVRGWVRPAQPENANPDRHPDDDGIARTRADLRAFRQYLSVLEVAGSDPWAAFRESLPYAVAFGLPPEWSERFAGLEPPGAAGAQGYPAAGLNQYLQAAGFANAACAHVHAVVSHGEYGGAGGHHGGGVSHGHGGGYGGGHGGGFGGGHH